MTDKHTPGPWTVSTGSVYVDNGKEWPTTPIAHMDRNTPFTRPTERDANARLIAAAPETAAERDHLRKVNAELLEALERIKVELDGNTPNRPALNMAVGIARAAIEAAKGDA